MALCGAVSFHCTAPKQQSSKTFDAEVSKFRDKLVQPGLYLKEANAMINTWRTSYFGTVGLRVFWIASRVSTDHSLPITIVP
ncbi:MAG: hypothetical protein ABI444_06480 [Candidatus Kapaibacterium sp.]|jgi:hypothetical protein